MNPHKVSRGSSFKGAAAYLLSGHIGEENPERVEWSATQNVGTDDIELAARIMAATWYDADATKRANGWDGRGRGTTKKPVLHLVMSWDENQNPDAAHMEQTARDMLKHMGLENAQAAMVGHNDTGQAHLHIMVNMIDPETGGNIDLGNDKRKMQSFALDYCREHGITSSPNREKNAELRAEAKRTGDTSQLEKMEGRKRLSRDEWLAMKEQLYERQKGERDALTSEQRAAWAEAIKDTQHRQEAERAALRSEQGAEWKNARLAMIEAHAQQRDQMKAQHNANWEAAKSSMRAEQAQQRAQWRQESDRQRAIVKAENKPQWAEIYKRQEREKHAALQALRQAEAKHQRAQTLLARGLAKLGIGPTRETTAQAVVDANLRAYELRGKHREQIEAKRRAQAETRSKRTKEAMQLWQAGRSFNADALAQQVKATHHQQWAALREQHNAERAAVGLKVDRQPDRAAAVPTVEAMKAEHRDQWQNLKDRQNTEKPYGELRAGHDRQWSELRARHHDEREKAGIKPAAARSTPAPDVGQERSEALRQERLRDGITRSEQIDRSTRSKWGDRPLSDDAKKAADKMRDRDREDRQRGRDDWGRDR